MTELYHTVVDFWASPATVLGLILSVAYFIHATRNVIITYIQTGKIPPFNDEGNTLDEIKNPGIVFGFMISFFLIVTPSLFLLIWPFSFTFTIFVLAIIIPVRNKRKKVEFIEGLKGQNEG